MLPNDDLTRWGEPPADDTELALANLLAEALVGDPPGETFSRLRNCHEADALLEMNGWMSQLIYTVLEQSGLLANLPPPAAPGEGPPSAAIEVRLAVSRALPGGLFQPVASSQAMPVVLRDLRRVPDTSDRVTLRTGERVRVEVVSNHPGFLAVLNVGPAGNLNMLYPEPGRAGPPIRSGEPLRILDIELVPPAGRERLYAIWTRQAVTVPQLAQLIQPGTVLRDMVRVQDALDRLPAGDWHAVMLELEHRPFN